MDIYLFWMKIKSLKTLLLNLFLFSFAFYTFWQKQINVPIDKEMEWPFHLGDNWTVLSV